MKASTRGECVEGSLITHLNTVTNKSNSVE